MSILQHLKMSNTTYTYVCFRYRKGEDPADWVTVDPVTGAITTSKSVDRESHFVKGNIYNVTVYAVDNGMTRRSFYTLYMLSINFFITLLKMYVFLVTR